MENVANKRRDHVELDLRVDENDAIFSTDNHENENPRRDPRDHSRERDGVHDREDSNGRDSFREEDDRRANTLDHSMEREGRPQKRPRGSHLEEGEIEEDEEPVKK